MLLIFLILSGCSPSTEDIYKQLESRPDLFKKLMDSSFRQYQKDNSKLSEVDISNKITFYNKNPIIPFIKNKRLIKNKVIVTVYLDILGPKSRMTGELIDRLVEDFDNLYINIKLVPESEASKRITSIYEELDNKSHKSAIKFISYIYSHLPQFIRDDKVAIYSYLQKNKIEAREIQYTSSINHAEVKKYKLKLPAFIINGVLFNEELNYYNIESYLINHTKAAR